MNRETPQNGQSNVGSGPIGVAEAGVGVGLHRRRLVGGLQVSKKRLLRREWRITTSAQIGCKPVSGHEFGKTNPQIVAAAGQAPTRYGNTNSQGITSPLVEASLWTSVPSSGRRRLIRNGWFLKTKGILRSVRFEVQAQSPLVVASVPREEPIRSGHLTATLPDTLAEFRHFR